MSGSDAIRRIKEKFALGGPPAASETAGNLLVPEPLRAKGGRRRKVEKMEQLNLRVPEEMKDRMRILAARDRMKLWEVLVEAIALYEEKYGPAPKLAPSRRNE